MAEKWQNKRKNRHQDYPVLRHMEVPHNIVDNEFWRKASLYQIIYSISGLVLGLICVFGGIILFIGGISGSTSWVANIIGAQSNISDAAPGAVLFIVGLFIVWITRFNLKVKK